MQSTTLTDQHNRPSTSKSKIILTHLLSLLTNWPNRPRDLATLTFEVMALVCDTGLRCPSV